MNSKEIILLRRLREVYKETIPIPSLKAKKRSRVMEEVNLVNCLIGNVNRRCECHHRQSSVMRWFVCNLRKTGIFIETWAAPKVGETMMAEEA